MIVRELQVYVSVECFPSVPKALDVIASTTYGMYQSTQHSECEGKRVRIQCHSQIYCKLGASLGYMTFCLKQIKVTVRVQYEFDYELCEYSTCYIVTIELKPSPSLLFSSYCLNIYQVSSKTPGIKL